MRVYHIAIFLLFAVFFTIYLSADLTTGLVAHYPFNGNADDETVNENDGTVTGATLTEDRFGNPSSAYYFDGNDYIDIGHLPQLENAEGFTISCWVYKTSQNRVDGFVGKWNSSTYNTGNVFLLYNGESSHANKCSFAVGAEDTSQNFATVRGIDLIPQNEWIHIAAVWSSTDGFTAVYKNGVLENSEYAESTIGKNIDYSQSYTAKIGAWGRLWGSDYYMKGNIDDVYIYNRALTDAEILSLYNMDTIDAPKNVQITTTIDSVQISWEEVTEATSYNIYSSDNPNEDFSGWYLEESGVIGTTWQKELMNEETKKFYYVRAAKD